MLLVENIQFSFQFAFESWLAGEWIPKTPENPVFGRKFFELVPILNLKKGSQRAQICKILYVWYKMVYLKMVNPFGSRWVISARPSLFKKLHLI